ncbi:hypothetical protein HU200_044604 [Digitaria exilis]|uniref:ROTUNDIFOLIA like 8 n=1 Tax=Digitaria exilis TaxID=1010633 RepID=A0A835EGC3_9POAL|nr:hypothetical protein HU200_044604 [Digitaria exilis]
MGAATLQKNGPVPSSAPHTQQTQHTPTSEPPQRSRTIDPSMEFYVDVKWKFSKKSRNNGSRRVPGAGASSGDHFLKRSSSMRDVPAIGRRGSGAAAAAAGGCGGAPQPSFSSRCAGLVKEQRARFYIMRRCVTMLVCWKDCSRSSVLLPPRPPSRSFSNPPRSETRDAGKKAD